MASKTKARRYKSAKQILITITRKDLAPWGAFEAHCKELKLNRSALIRDLVFEYMAGLSRVDKVIPCNQCRNPIELKRLLCPACATALLGGKVVAISDATGSLQPPAGKKPPVEKEVEGRSGTENKRQS